MKNKIKTLIFILISILVSTGGLSARGRLEKNPGQLREGRKEKLIEILLIDDPWAAFIIDRLDEFEEQSGIEVKYQLLPEENYLSLLNLQLISRITSPDVFMIFAERDIQKFYYSNWLEVLDKKNIEKNENFAFSIESCTWQGELVAVPAVLLNHILAVNESLFVFEGNDRETSLEEVQSLARESQKNDISGIIMRANGKNAVLPWLDFLYILGGEWLGLENNRIIDISLAVSATDYYTDILEHGTHYSIIYNSVYENCSLFLEEQSKMIYEWSLYSGLFDNEKWKSEKKPVYYNIIGPDGNVPPVGTLGLSIYKESNNKDFALEFIEWATSKELARDMISAKIPAANKRSWEQKTFTGREVSWWSCHLERFKAPVVTYPKGYIRESDILKIMSGTIVESYLNDNTYENIINLVKEIKKMIPFDSSWEYEH
jgi:multiple sugar transport system substrate-binding protein